MKLFLQALIILSSLSLNLLACSSQYSDNNDATAHVVSCVFDKNINDSAEYLVILGDLQAMTAVPSNRIYLEKTVKWINDQLLCHPNTIKAVIQNGDITDKNSDSEWKFASSLLMPLSYKVPLVISTGNHDYDWVNSNIYSRQTSKINQYFRCNTLPGQTVQTFEDGSIENAIHTILFGGRSLHILALEFAPRKEVVEWADSIITSCPDSIYIIVSHEFLEANGNIVNNNNSYAKMQMKDGSSVVTPTEIWEQLAFNHDNVRAIVCGHNGFCKVRSTPNSTGRIIPQVLFNLQYQDNGGKGLVMLWETVDGSHINVKVYSTIKYTVLEDNALNFTIEI